MSRIAKPNGCFSRFVSAKLDPFRTVSVLRSGTLNDGLDLPLVLGVGHGVHSESRPPALVKRRVVHNVCKRS